MSTNYLFIQKLNHEKFDYLIYFTKFKNFHCQYDYKKLKLDCDFITFDDITDSTYDENNIKSVFIKFNRDYKLSNFVCYVLKLNIKLYIAHRTEKVYDHIPEYGQKNSFYGVYVNPKIQKYINYDVNDS